MKTAAKTRKRLPPQRFASCVPQRDLYLAEWFVALEVPKAVRDSLLKAS